jgi:hypothetical protein
VYRLFSQVLKNTQAGEGNKVCWLSSQVLKGGQDYEVKKVYRQSQSQFVVCLFVLLLLYALRYRSVLGAAGHIILTPANQLMEE